MKPLSILFLLVLLASCAAPPTPAGAPLSTGAATPALATQPSTPTAAPSSRAPLMVRKDNGAELHLIDLATGAGVAGSVPLTLGKGIDISAHALAPNLDRLALVSGVGASCQAYAGGSSCYPAADSLHLVDLIGWQEIIVPLTGNDQLRAGFITQLTFSPDGSRLALAYNHSRESTLLVYDAQSGALVAHQALDFQPELLSYVLDGKSLAVYGAPPGPEPGITQPGSPRLQLLDSLTLETSWELKFESMLSGEWCLDNCDASHELRTFALWRPGLALSPDGSRFYIVHADQEMLSTLDLATSALHDGAIDTASGWLERLLARTAGVAHAKGPRQGAIKTAAISLDGSRLYVLANRFTIDPPAAREGQTLQTIDLESGRALVSASLNPDRPIYSLQVSPGGEQLLLLGYAGKKPYAQALKADTLEPAAELIGWELVSFSPAIGETLLLARRDTGQATELAVVEPQSLKVLHSWQVEGEAAWLAAP